MRQVLVFRIGERLCGLDIIRIREVVESPVCHYIPRAPKWCEGAINVQGQVLPVIDLPEFFGSTAAQTDHRCIVLDVAPGNLALRVTAIHRIIVVDDDAVLLPESEGRKPLVMATLQIEDSRIELLDAGAVLQAVQQTMGENA
jgi:purine-binding chemotaxis protein CheW